MSVREVRTEAGAAGPLEVVVDRPSDGLIGIALVAHPHPLMGGTLDNKVAQTLARACSEAGCLVWRPNFRGAGASAGVHDGGQGETEDLLLLCAALRKEHPDLPLFLGGFSFGAFVQTRVAQRLASQDAPARRLMLVGTAVARFDVAPVPADTLLIHGEQDDVITLAALLDWARPQDLPVLVVPGADHFFHRRLHLIRHAVRTAVLETLHTALAR